MSRLGYGVRTLLLSLTIALAGCNASDDRGATAMSAPPLAPDAIVLRIAARGGVARAYRYPTLDSAIWTTRSTLPAQVRPLAFSTDAGTLALADSMGVAWRLTLGSGVLERAMATPLRETVSLDGSSIFGLSDGAVLRLTTTQATPWLVRTVASINRLQPLRDGGVLLVGHRGTETVITRFRPPSTTAVDSAVLPGNARLISAAGGDRYYLSDGPRRLVSVRARDLETLGTISIGDSIVATASSPSGDRVYVLGRDDAASRVQVISKYADAIVATVEVPTSASDLRMDPLGRYLLVRHGAEGDSVVVIGVATNSVLGRFASPWRADLPMVFPDGRIATLRGNDVVTLAEGDFRPLAVTPDGAKDIWMVVQWNGFSRRGDAPVRARVVAPDTSPRRPVVVDTAAEPPPVDSVIPDSVPAPATARAAPVPERSPPSDSARRARTRSESGQAPSRSSAALRAKPPADSDRRVAVRKDSARRAGAATVRIPAATTTAPAQTGGERGSFVVQFAALKAERTAREIASKIKANGEKARIMVTTTNGTALYRVILGPFRSRPEAERAGRAAGRDYWVFDGGSD